MKKSIRAIMIAGVFAVSAASVQAGDLFRDLGRAVGQATGQVKKEAQRQAPNQMREAEKAIAHAQDAAADFVLAAKRGYRDATR